MLNIYTYQNSLKSEGIKDKYCFRSVVDQGLDNEQLVKEIVSYNSTITEADPRAVLSVLNDRVKHFVRLGYKVELPFGYIFNKANGTVSRLNEGFAPGTSNHRITTMFRFKSDIEKEMTENAAYKIAGTGFVQIPLIKEVCAILSDGTEEESLEFSCGDILRIKGNFVSFDASDKTQGLFLVASDKSEKRISAYNRIGTKIIEGYVPKELYSGLYEVKLVTKPGIDRYESCVFSTKISVKAE